MFGTPTTLGNGFEIKSYVDKNIEFMDYLKSFASDSQNAKIILSCMWAMLEGHEENMYEKNNMEGKFNPKEKLDWWYKRGYSKEEIIIQFKFWTEIFLKGNAGSRISAIANNNLDNKSITDPKTGIIDKDTLDYIKNIKDPKTKELFFNSNDIDPLFSIIKKHFQYDNNYYGMNFVGEIHKVFSGWAGKYQLDFDKKKSLNDELRKIFNNNDKLKNSLIFTLEFIKKENLIKLSNIGFKFIKWVSDIKEVKNSYIISIKNKNSELEESEYKLSSTDKTNKMADFVIKNPEVRDAFKLLLETYNKEEDEEREREDDASLIERYFKYQGYSKLNLNPDTIYAEINLSLADSNYVPANIKLEEGKDTKKNIRISFRGLTGSDMNFYISALKRSYQFKEIIHLEKGDVIIKYNCNNKEKSPFYMKTPSLKAEIKNGIIQKIKIYFTGEDTSCHGFDGYNDEKSSIHPLKKINSLETIDKWSEELNKKMEGETLISENIIHKVALAKGHEYAFCSKESYKDTNELMIKSNKQQLLAKYLSYSLENVNSGCKISRKEINSILKKLGGINIMSVDLGYTPTYHLSIYKVTDVNSDFNYDIDKMRSKRISSNLERDSNLEDYLWMVKKEGDDLNNTLNHILYCFGKRRNKAKFITLDQINLIEDDILRYKNSMDISLHDVQLFKKWCLQKINNTLLGKKFSSFINHVKKIELIKLGSKLKDEELIYWKDMSNKFNITIEQIKKMNFISYYTYLIIYKNYINIHKSVNGKENPYYKKFLNKLDNMQYHTETLNYHKFWDKFNNIKINAQRHEANSILKHCLDNNVKIVLLGKSSSIIRNDDNEFADVVGINTRNKIICDKLIRNGITVLGISEYLSSQYHPQYKMQGFRDPEHKKNVYFNVNNNVIIENSEFIACDNMFLSFILQRTYIKSITAIPINEEIATLNIDEMNTSTRSFILYNLNKEYEKIGKMRFWKLILLRKVNDLWEVSIAKEDELKIIKSFFEENKGKHQDKKIKFMRFGDKFTAKVIRNKEDIVNSSHKEMLAISIKG